MNVDRGVCSALLLHFSRLHKPHTLLRFKSAQHLQATVLSTLHPKMPTLCDRCLKQQVKPGPGAFRHVAEPSGLLPLTCVPWKTSPPKRGETWMQSVAGNPPNVLVHKTCPAAHVPQLFA